MGLFENLLVVGILLILAIVLYSKFTHKTLSEIVREIREIINPPEIE